MNQIIRDAGELTLREVFHTIWTEKLIVLIIITASLLIAFVAAWTLPKTYSATTLIDPVSSTPGGGATGALSAVASQLGGLASLAGFSGGTDSKKSEAIATLQSELITEAYIKEASLLPVLYSDKWDAARNGWKDPGSSSLPTLWKANQRFKKDIRSVTTDLKTGLVTLTIKWKNPDVAARWANDLVRVTNQYMRSQAIAESEKNIAYLTREAAQSVMVEARQAIYKVMENEINKLMIARGNEEYGFKVIDPAAIPEKPSFPQKLNWILGGLFLGIVFGISTALIKASWTKNNLTP